MNKKAFLVTLSVIWLLLSTFSFGAIPAYEREALIALYNSTNGDNWANNSGWKSPPLHTDGFAMPGTEFSWYGIYYIPGSELDHVPIIYLAANNLTGKIPSALKYLSRLNSLILRSNLITESIPSELEYLQNLQVLDLSGNKLTGCIPPELGNLLNLVELDLASNQLEGIIPIDLGKISKLQRLILSNNNLIGSIPSELGNLSNLRTLALSPNLTGEIPPSLGNLTKLSYLQIWNNQLSGNIPKTFGKLTNLIILQMDSNQLTGRIPQELGNLTKLEVLGLGNNNLTGSIPPELGNLNNLYWLSLGYNQLSGSIPPELGNLSNLGSLLLESNQLGGTIPPELGNLSNLGKLLLRFNKLSGNFPIAVCNLVNLEFFNIGDNEFTGNIPSSIGNLQNLRSLNLCGNQFNGSIPSNLGNLTRLEDLHLEFNELSGPIPDEFGNLQQLWHLFLQGNQLSGEIPTSLTNLTRLAKPNVDIGDNCLFTNDKKLKEWLNNVDPDWEKNQDQCGGCLILSLESKYNGNPHFIAGVDFPVEFTADVDWGNETPSIVRFITPKGSYDVPTTGSTASITFNIATEFNACTSLKAIAISTDGTKSQEKTADMIVTPTFFPGILVKAFHIGGEYYYNSSFGLNLVDEKTKEVNPDIPLFGANKFGLKYIPQVKAKVEMNGNVSINLDWDEWSIKKLNIAGFELSLNPTLQIKGIFQQPGCEYNWAGSAGLSTTQRISKSWPFIFTAGPIPIPMYTKASIGVSLNGAVNVEDINPLSFNGEFGTNVTARGTLGAGIDEVINVEGWIQGGADFVLQWPNKPAKTLTISLTGGVSATAFLWKWENELLRWEWNDNGTGSNNTQKLSLIPPRRPKIIPRDYLRSKGIFKKRMSYLSLPLNEVNSSRTIASGPLQTSVLPYSHANLSSNNTQMSLVWVQDDSSRASLNRTIAVYSSFNGSIWMDPQPIWDDGTADFHPRSVTFSDGSVIAVWEDEKKELTESAQFKDMLKNMEISVSVFNSNTNKWDLTKKITSNNHFDFSPKISGNHLNNAMIVWLANESNELRGSSNAPSKIYYSKYDGTNLTTAALAAQVPMGILKYDFIYNGNKGYIVLSLDTDDDPSTIDDHELYLLTYENGNWSSINRLTNDNIVDGNPRIAPDSYGNIILSWTREDGVYSSINFDITNKTTVISEEYSSNLADLKMISSSKGRLAMIWAEPSENSSDLYVSLYDRSNMVWKEPEQITFDSETERNITAAFYGENTLISVYNRNNIEETQTSITTSNGQVTYVTPEIISTDLYMVKLELEEEEIEPTAFQLNRTHLYFGSVINGSCTSSQKILITKSGTSPLYWSASDNSPWLNCTPSSGMNSSEMSVFVEPTGLSAGTYIDTITISAPNATNPQQSISVTLQVYRNGATTFPFGEFATPINGSTVRSSIPVTGWVLDDIGVENVKIYREEKGALVFIGDAVFVEGARPDVEQAYPEYPMNYKSGWGYMMLTNFLPNGGNGTFKIHAVAVDLEGHQVTLGTKTIICDNANAVKPFGAIDTPTQGGTASGNKFVNWGWVLTPQPNSIPIEGSTINVYIDGVNLGHPTYNIYRSDIAQLFPGYKNSDGAAGYFSFDTTSYTNGVHTMQWTATDNGGNSDGIGSRYFTIQNTGNSQSKAQTTSSGKIVTGQKFFHLSHIVDIPLNDSESIRVKRGLKDNIEPELVSADESGDFIIKIKELERLVIEFSKKSALIEGYTIVRDELRPLPIGSIIDFKEKKFYWQPGPGFVGYYRFVFIERSEYNQIKKKNIIVKIEPKSMK